MAAGMISLVLLMLVLGGLITGIVLWSTSGTGGGNEMACGRCGYAVRGLTQLSCPECGTDLREGGIRPSGSPGKRTAGMVLTIVSGGVLMLGCGLSMFAFMSLGSSSSHSTPIGSPSAPAPVQQYAPPNGSAQPDPADPAADSTDQPAQESGP